MSKTFKQLEIGQSFDFVNDAQPRFNSFFKRCEKISARRYRDDSGAVHNVGTINCKVFHVGCLICDGQHPVGCCAQDGHGA